MDSTLDEFKAAATEFIMTGATDSKDVKDIVDNAEHKHALLMGIISHFEETEALPADIPECIMSDVCDYLIHPDVVEMIVEDEMYAISFGKCFEMIIGRARQTLHRHEYNIWNPNLIKLYIALYNTERIRAGLRCHNPTADDVAALVSDK